MKMAEILLGLPVIESHRSWGSHLALDFPPVDGIIIPASDRRKSKKCEPSPVYSIQYAGS